MQISGAKILVLGGWGLVGSAICRELMKNSPKTMIISSLKKEEAIDACEQLKREFPKADPNMFVPVWGNIFTRNDWKDQPWGEVLNETKQRKTVVNDIFDDLDGDILSTSALYRMIMDNQPDLVIDCINTATAFAYLDIYTTTQTVKRELKENNSASAESVERLMSNMYIPQLIRHIQILYKGLCDAKSTMYLKIGTSGTGGMGLNIPYTHSEERPSRVLLSKTAMAGAQTLLLFLMARTPDGPLVKEIKPTAAIAWKRITYDKVRRKGRTIPMVDMTADKALPVDGSFSFKKIDGVTELGRDFESVFIDTGENGIFSRGEFEAIASLGQMEIVTPEEIATYAIHEIRGGNTGYDVIQGLDGFTLGPTYRGGMLFHSAMDKLKQLEKDNDCASIAFEMLGPPRLSKLLFEAHLLKKVAQSMKGVLATSPEKLSEEATKIINNDADLRSQMLSIGLVILMPDGKNYIRGNEVKIPSFAGSDEIKLTNELIEKWCYDAWIDLRPSNFVKWHDYLKAIINEADAIPESETGSRYNYTREYWGNFEEINGGKIVGWVFENDDKGWRFKR